MEILIIYRAIYRLLKLSISINFNYSKYTGLCLFTLPRIRFLRFDSGEFMIVITIPLIQISIYD